METSTAPRRAPVHCLAPPRAWVLAAVCLSSLPAWAEDQQLEEITVRGERESFQQERLTTRDIQERPASDLGELLGRVEGIGTVHKGATADDIVLRGLKRDDVNVLVDGVRVHGACPGRMDPPSFHYDVAEVDEVVVVKGPYDLTNPGGVGGLVEARSAKPPEGPDADLRLTYGSFDRLEATAVGSYGSRRLDALLGYAHRESEVPRSGSGAPITRIYPTSGPRAAGAYRPDTIDSTAYDVDTGWARFGVRPTASSRSDVSYAYREARHVLYPYLRMDADGDTSHRLNWTYGVQDLSPRTRDVRVQAYWDEVDHLMDDRLRLSSRPAMMVTRPYSMQTEATTRVVGAKAHGAIAIGPGTLRSGLDCYDRNWDAVSRRAMFRRYADHAMIPDVSVGNVGMFSEYELPLGAAAALRGGLRADLTRAEAHRTNTLVRSGTAADFAALGGNVQLTYIPFPGLRLFTGLARATRPPDPQELYLDLPAPPMAMAPMNVTWRGNPDLDPTVNHQADVGARYATARHSATVALFYGDLEDFVNPTRVSPTLKSYRNIHATLWGTEAGIRLTVCRHASLRAALAYVEGRNASDDRPLAEIPPLAGVVAARWDDGAFFFEVAENLARRQDRVDPALNERETPGWATTDARAGYRYRGLSVFAGVENLFDRYYFSHLSYLRDPFAAGVGRKVPQSGRSFHVTAAWTFP